MNGAAGGAVAALNVRTSKPTASTAPAALRRSTWSGYCPGARADRGIAMTPAARSFSVKTTLGPKGCPEGA